MSHKLENYVSKGHQLTQKQICEGDCGPADAADSRHDASGHVGGHHRDGDGMGQCHVEAYGVCKCVCVRVHVCECA